MPKLYIQAMILIVWQMYKNDSSQTKISIKTQSYTMITINITLG